MKRIFSVIMALMLIISTTSQAYVVTVHGENCTYTLSSKANRGITLSDKRDNVRWWKVVDTYKNIIGVINSRFIMPEGNVEVTPMLTGNQIVIEQTTNGNITYGGNAVNTIETTEGADYTLTITPNEGYEIATVKVDNVALGTSEIITSGMNYTFSNVNENHVITATYIVATTPAPEPEPTTYTVSFNANGGTGTMENQTFTAGTAQTLSANKFIKTGYTFAGWTDEEGNTYTNQASFTATKNTTLTAKWTTVTYTITYNLDGGTASNPTSYTIETTSFTLSEPTKDGYTFTGWTGSNGTTAQTEVTITKGSTGDKEFTANWEKKIVQANAPVITTGLTPVNWNGSSWVTTTESNWDYNYNSVAETTSNGTVAGNGNGKWANAQTADGSMYVWIPRYTYKITSGYHEDVDSWNADSGDNKTGKIEIKFSNGTTDDNSDSYISHPAFTFGSDELKGIWVAKFEASMEDGNGNHVDTSSNSTGNVVLSDSVKLVSKPGVSSWRYISVSNMFDNAYNLNRSFDSHLMKNVEWGAVAYLTNAIGRIPYINNSSSYITGNAGGSQDARKASGVTNAWNTTNGVKASTTHNIYGIYDMSGGAIEYVAAYYTGGSSSYISSLESADSKYVDRYDDTYTSSNLGDAVYETSGDSSSVSWDGDLVGLPYSDDGLVFRRGGRMEDTSKAGIFSIGFMDGSEGHLAYGFRPVLAIQ